MDKMLRTIILMLFIMGLGLPLSYAYDIDPHYKFSGVKSPDSPLKNTWGAFQTDLFSGSFSYEYKIDVPPGTNGLTPKISIGYNSHSAKGKAGWVGAGWEIPLSYIQRNIQYTRKDTSDDTFELYLDGAKHDLVYVASEGKWHTKNESYLKIEKKTGGQNTLGDYWVVTDKDGTEYRFGYNPASENLIRSSDASFSPYVWRWSLERIHDPNDNCICFNYVEDQGAVYLDNIKYNSCNNDGNRVIQFMREAKPDAYLILDQGSEVYDAYRLYEIQIFVSGAPVRKYRFSYVLNEPQNKSLLTSIMQYGADGTSSLPPVKFEYALLNSGFSASTEWNTPGEKVIRKVDNDHNDTIGDTFDVNGDGLPDVVRYDETDFPHWDIWVNTGSGFSETNLKWSVPNDWAIRNNNVYIKNEQSPDTKTSPMDINRDGYIDFLRADGDGKLEFRINLGNNFSGTTESWTLPINAYIRDVRRPDDTDPNVKQAFFDINGDGLPDLIQKNDDYSWNIWRNTRNGFENYGIWTVYNNDGWLEDFYRNSDGTKVYTQVNIYDMNGDGLPDILDAHDNDWKIYWNTGSNFISGGTWHTDYEDKINDVDSDGDIKRDLIDINGDGLPDIVNPIDGVRDWEVQYNTGRGFTEKKHWYVPDDVSQNGYITKIEESNNITETTRDVFDIDGDGAGDLIRKFSDRWKVNFNKSGQADLLSKITDTLGGTVSINYNSSAKYSNTRLPFNYWVVSSVETNNGMTGTHSLISTTKYSYAQGLYDFPTRESRGFGTVAETRADSSKVIHYYYQDNAKKGKEYKTETKNSADAPFASIQNTFSEALSNGVYISNVVQTDEYNFDGTQDNPKLKRKEYQNYDAFGNVGLLIDHGDWNSGGDEVYTYNEYWPSCSSAYIVDKLKHKYIKPSLAGSNLREGFYWYDNSTSCVSKGNLTKEENWLNTGGNPITLYEYDSYGNRNKTTDPEGRVTRFEFDSTYHTFPVNSYNAKNQLTTRSFNVVNGQVIQETDPNGFTTTYVYDTFQRKIREVKPYDTDSSPTVAIQYVMDGIPPESVIVYKKDGTPTFDTVQFIDGFGNLIQTKAEYESDMNKTVVDVFYDEMGRVKKQSNPYLTDSTLAYSSPDVLAPGTGYTYDSLGRPIQIQNPDGTQINRTFDHWTVNETDENGHAKSYAFDASQRLKRVVENNGGSSYTTNYVYSPLGELKTITDHQGNVTTISYDSLGRKISMIDPDMGTWTYGYDKVGNLVKQTDARGIMTKIGYDQLNRKLQVDYPNNADVQFMYDVDTKGTLSMVYSGAGTASYQSVIYMYDQRLRKAVEGRTIDGNTWITRWAYDSMERVTSMTYPEGQTVTFNYNAQGKLDNIPGIITGIDYNASGQITRKNYANGKSTTYAYHPSNLRLTSLATSGIQNFTYTYDNVGNIKSITDGISVKTENFGYDDLDRVTGAGDGTYGIQYQYNPIGNMLSMTKNSKLTQFTYGAGAAIPHAVTGMTIPIPVVGSFVINNDSPQTSSHQATLNNVSYGNPTHFMASEDEFFAGASWQPYSTAPSFMLSKGVGKKTVYFKVKNADGESNFKSDSIEVLDLEKPTSVITQPINGSSLYTNVLTIRGTADDGAGSGVQKVEVSTDGGTTWNLATGTTLWNYEWIIPSDGTYNIKSRATDNADNMETPGSGITIKIDATAPTNGTLSATPGNAQVSLSWSGFTDSGSGLRITDTYKVVRNTGTYPNSQCTSGTQIYLGTGTSKTDAGLTNGTTYYYRACAYDNAGNVSTGATASATPRAPIPDISVNPTSIPFGDVNVGSTSSPQTVTVSNDGTGNLNIGSVSITGPDASDASQFIKQVDACSGNSLAPSETCQIQLVFRPASTGSKTATLTIASNDPDEGAVIVTLTGNGAASVQRHGNDLERFIKHLLKEIGKIVR